MIGPDVSLVRTTAVHNGGLPGVPVGTAIVAVVAVFVAARGVIVFEDLPPTADQPHAVGSDADRG